MSDGVCTVAEWDIIVQNKSSSQSQCHGWAGHLWHCAWQVWYVGVGRDVLQHLHCAALGAFLSFSCQLCIFPKEHAAQLFSERRHWIFGMGWLHLHSCVCRWRISLWLPGLFFGGPVKNQPWTYPPLTKWTISCFVNVSLSSKFLLVVFFFTAYLLRKYFFIIPHLSISLLFLQLLGEEFENNWFYNA